MIHGGIKYTLSGALSGASEAIAGMPAHWRSCLRGEGDVDLRGGSVLSDHFYLWSANNTAAKLTTFLASKATRGRVGKVAKKDLPAILQNLGFKGSVYKLVDMVLDVPGILRLLAAQAKEQIYKIDWQHARLNSSGNSAAPALQIDIGSDTLNINSKAIIFAAGQGNEALLQNIGATAPTMQRRPLHQVMVKHHHPHTFYGHCLGTDTTPRLTISSHFCEDSSRGEDGSQIWYLGGSLAEKGVGMSPGLLIDQAKAELNTLLPWVNLEKAQWATLAIDRAEPKQLNFGRPDQAHASWAEGCKNVIAAWPTKLTLAPNLGNTVVELLDQESIKPSHQETPNLSLPAPPIAASPWQVALGD